MATRIQRRRTKGWRMPEGAVYVGRPTRYGNPFTGGEASENVANFRLCIERFPVEQWKIDRWRSAGGSVTDLVCLAGRVESFWSRLRGRDLACWCPLDMPCHADVLLEIANG